MRTAWLIPVFLILFPNRRTCFVHIPTLSHTYYVIPGMWAPFPSSGNESMVSPPDNLEGHARCVNDWLRHSQWGASDHEIWREVSAGLWKRFSFLWKETNKKKRFPLKFWMFSQGQKADLCSHFVTMTRARLSTELICQGWQRGKMESLYHWTATLINPGTILPSTFLIISLFD